MNIVILILGIFIQTVTIYRSSRYFKKKLSQSTAITFGMILVETSINALVSFTLSLLTLYQVIWLCEIDGGEYCSNGELFIYFLIPASVIWGILSTFISKFLAMRGAKFRNVGLIFLLLFLGIIILTLGLFSSVQKNEKIKGMEEERQKTLLSTEDTFICDVNLSRRKPYSLEFVSGYKIEDGIFKFYETSYSVGFLDKTEEAGFVSGNKIILKEHFYYLMNGIYRDCKNNKGETFYQLYELTLPK